MEAKETARKMFSSFIPSEYDGLSDRSFNDIAKHFLLALLIFILIMAVMNIPKAVNYPEKFSSEFSKFTRFKVNVNASAPSPVDLWLVKIDTNNNTELDREGVKFTKNYLQIKYLRFMPPLKQNISEYKDFVKSSENVRNHLIVLGILLIPSLLFASYLYYFIKFLLIILITAFIGFIISRSAKHDAGFLAIFKVCLYASPLLMLELVVRIFNLNLLIEQGIPLLLFLIYVIIGISKAGGEFKKRRKKGAFEIVGKKGFEIDE